VTRLFDWLRLNFEYVFIIGGVFAVGETTLLVVSAAIMKIGKQSAASANKKWEERRQEMAAKRGTSGVVLNRGAGPAGEAPGLKGDWSAGGDTQVIGSFNPDAVWGATKIQASFRASKRNADAGPVAFEVEEQPSMQSGVTAETWNNPTYPAYSPDDSQAYVGDIDSVGLLPPPSLADLLPPPSESDFGQPPPPSQSDWEDPVVDPLPPESDWAAPPPPPPQPEGYT
jgi:hypothetical protein